MPRKSQEKLYVVKVRGFIDKILQQEVTPTCHSYLDVGLGVEVNLDGDGDHVVAFGAGANLTTRQPGVRAWLAQVQRPVNARRHHVRGALYHSERGGHRNTTCRGKQHVAYGRNVSQWAGRAAG